MMGEIPADEIMLFALVSLVLSVMAVIRVYEHFARISLLKAEKATLHNNLTATHKVLRKLVMEPIAASEMNNSITTVSLDQDAINALYEMDALIADTLQASQPEDTTHD